MITQERRAHRPCVVIVGAGFGGLSAAMALANYDFAVTLIDRHNYHLFQPLLYQVATAALSPADIALPIRGIMRRHTNVSVILADVSGIDLDRREVIAEDHRIGFDTLVIATGAQHAYFGHDEWASFAPGLKTIDDATYLRRRILLAFEKAESETDPLERRRLLNFVVVGGGPTGVEMAGAVAELAKRALATDFRAIDPRQANVILVEAAPRLLTPFDVALSAAAKLALEEIGVDVRLGVGVTGGDCAGVSVGDERIEARTVIWAAGVAASPAGLWLGAETDQAGRVLVEPDLSLPGHPDIFVIGDAASAQGPDGKPLPGVAPVAKQQGAYVARLIKARAQGRNQPAPFRYRWLAGYDRAAARRCANRAVQVQRFCRLAAMVRGSHLFPDRIPQSSHCCYELGLELHYVPTWNASDYRHDRRSHRSGAGANLQRTDEFRECASCRLTGYPAKGFANASDTEIDIR
jgi:NADH:ubiquinone reductase (H+-translocating)